VKRAVAPLDDGRVRLRLLEERDLETTLGWRNRDEIRRWFFHSDVVALESHRAWFGRNLERDDDFVFVIEELQELRRPVGQISLYNVDWPARRCEYGRLIVGDPEARGRGLAQAATRLVLRQAFDTFGLDEVYLEVIASNAAAIAVYDACGFRRTQERDDVVRMSILRPA
jgi:diamine N-acetyltransferase